MKRNAEEEIIYALKRMEERSVDVHKHQDITQNIFYKWQAAIENDNKVIWSDIINHIEGTISFITEHKNNFPNSNRHIEQYSLLLDIAKERLISLD